MNSLNFFHPKYPVKKTKKSIEVIDCVSEEEFL
jgi:hypothetical protein